jgi:DNA mismatch repair protein MutH
VAEYGLWEEGYDEVMLGQLAVAYIRRQQWLARLQAAEVVKALGEAMGGDGQSFDRLRMQRGRRVAPGEFLRVTRGSGL